MNFRSKETMRSFATKFIDSSRIKETLQQCDNSTRRMGEGKSFRVLVGRNQYENATTQRVWMVIELYRLEGHHFVSLSFKGNARMQQSEGGIYSFGSKETM